MFFLLRLRKSKIDVESEVDDIYIHTKEIPNAGVLFDINEYLSSLTMENFSCIRQQLVAEYLFK